MADHPPLGWLITPTRSSRGGLTTTKAPRGICLVASTPRGGKTTTSTIRGGHSHPKCTMEVVATTLNRTGAQSWPPLALLVGVANHPIHGNVFLFIYICVYIYIYIYINKEKMDQKILKNIAIIFVRKSTAILRIKEFHQQLQLS